MRYTLARCLMHGPATRKHVAPRRTLQFALCLALLLTLIQNPKSKIQNRAFARPQPQPASAQWVTPRGGTPYFVIGANYEGPTDRAWMMWDDDKFDANLISYDFARAKSLGINTLRIFVQPSLRDDINA